MDAGGGVWRRLVSEGAATISLFAFVFVFVVIFLFVFVFIFVFVFHSYLCLRLCLGLYLQMDEAAHPVWVYGGCWNDHISICHSFLV